MSEKNVDELRIDGGIVVGHDGSSVADLALRWAVEEAKLRNLPVHVLRAWTLSAAIPLTGVPFGTVPSLGESRQAVAEHLAASVAAVDTAGVEDSQHVFHGSAVQALISAGDEAEMVVVGQRGEGGFAGLRLGSVADQIVRHAPCTVVIVRCPPD